MKYVITDKNFKVLGKDGKFYVNSNKARLFNNRQTARNTRRALSAKKQIRLWVDRVTNTNPVEITPYE